MKALTVGPRRVAAFTLLEMLVTLVLVSLIGLILSQALYQAGRIERLLAEGQLRAMATALRVEWVRDALAGLRSDERFIGNARELQGLTTAVPQAPLAGLGTMRLSLRFNERGGLTELFLAREPLRTDVLRAPELPPLRLLSWPGNSGSWRYLDDRGAWHDSWPVSQGGARDSNRLPVAVALETGDAELGTVLAAIVTGTAQMPSRKQMERL